MSSPIRFESNCLPMLPKGRVVDWFASIGVIRRTCILSLWLFLYWVEIVDSMLVQQSLGHYSINGPFGISLAGKAQRDVFFLEDSISQKPQRVGGVEQQLERWSLIRDERGIHQKMEQ